MERSAGSRETRAELQLLAVAIIWAANYPLAKFAIAGLQVFLFNSIRFVVAAAVLALLFFARTRWMSIVREDWPRLLQAGVVASILYQVAFIVGLSMTTAGNSAILLATAPLWTVLISARMHKEQIRPRTWVGMSISLAGIAMIIIGSGRKLELGSNALAGDLISLGAAIFWAFNTNLQKPLLVRYSALQIALFLTSIGAVGLTLLAVPAGLMTDWESIHWTYFLAAIGSGAFSIGVANAFWSYGVQRLGPGRTANFGNLIPVLAFIFSYITLREQVLPIQILGAAVTLAGVWTVRR